MPTIEVQHSFQGVSGDAKDQYANTFHFIGPADDIALLGELAVLVQSFYKAPPEGQGVGLVNYYSNQCLGAGEHIKMFDLSQPKPRTALYDALNPAAVVAPNSALNLPDQVSVVLSLEAWLDGSGLDENPGPTNIARRRGRLYLGPFNSQAVNATGRTQCRVSEEVATIAVAAATQLMGDALAAGFTWCVYSRANNQTYTLARVWVNDAFDIQRRRALKPVSRVRSAPGAPFLVS